MIDNYIRKVQLMARCTYNNGSVELDNFKKYYKPLNIKAKC